MAHKITDECVACGACADTCPVGAISLRRCRYYVVDADTCVDCGACEDVCPNRCNQGRIIFTATKEAWGQPVAGLPAPFFVKRFTVIRIL